MMVWILTRRRLHGLIFVLAVALAGCGSGKGTVTGQVRFKGQPLPSGRIVFVCEGGDKPALMADILDGAYTIANAPVGECKITVATFQTKTTSVPFQPKDASSPPGGATSQGKFVPIPARYGDTNQSGLTYRIVSGSQSHDVELE